MLEIDADRAPARLLRKRTLKEVMREPQLQHALLPRISRSSCLPDVIVPIPGISYGDIEPPVGIADFPAGSWKDTSFQITDGQVYALHDAIIHGEQGIITLDDIVLSESLFHTLPKLQGFGPDADGNLLADERMPDLCVDKAGYVMCGFVGNRGYAHWIVDVIPSILVPPFDSAFEGTTLIFPPLRAGWQRETLDLLPEINSRSLFIGENMRVSCRELRIVPRIQRSDFLPHPHRRKIVAMMKARAGCNMSPQRRIYVSRRDTRRRRLLNEDVVIAMVHRYGFEVVELSSLPVAEQIRLFGSASHIIAPHGAGLANLTFCAPGAAVCELHMDSYVQWAMRRLAAATGLRYGCIIGQSENSTLPLHMREWRISLDRLEHVLNDPNFAGEAGTA